MANQQPTAEERRKLTTQAVRLSVRGVSYVEIARQLGISRNFASKLVKEEYAHRAEHRDQDRERAIAQYEEVIAEGWKRLSRLDDRSNNVTGVLNAIRGAQDSINGITGIEAAAKLEHSGPDGGPIEHVEVNDETAAMLDALALRKANDGEDDPASN